MATKAEKTKRLGRLIYFFSCNMCYICLSYETCLQGLGTGTNAAQLSCPQWTHVMLCYVMLCYVMLCYVMLCYVMLCYVMLCYVMLCYVMLCYVMLCYVMLCYVMLCYVMLCYVMHQLYPNYFE